MISPKTNGRNMSTLSHESYCDVTTADRGPPDDAVALQRADGNEYTIRPDNSKSDTNWLDIHSRLMVIVASELKSGVFSEEFPTINTPLVATRSRMWSLSRKQRNKLAHTLTGNTTISLKRGGGGPRGGPRGGKRRGGKGRSQRYEDRDDDDDRDDPFAGLGDVKQHHKGGPKYSSADFKNAQQILNEVSNSILGLNAHAVTVLRWSKMLGFENMPSLEELADRRLNSCVVHQALQAYVEEVSKLSAAATSALPKTKARMDHSQVIRINVKRDPKDEESSLPPTPRAEEIDDGFVVSSSEDEADPGPPPLRPTGLEFLHMARAILLKHPLTVDAAGKFRNDWSRIVACGDRSLRAVVKKAIAVYPFTTAEIDLIYKAQTKLSFTLAMGAGVILDDVAPAVDGPDKLDVQTDALWPKVQKAALFSAGALTTVGIVFKLFTYRRSSSGASSTKLLPISPPPPLTVDAWLALKPAHVSVTSNSLTIPVVGSVFTGLITVSAGLFALALLGKPVVRWIVEQFERRGASAKFRPMAPIAPAGVVALAAAAPTTVDRAELQTVATVVVNQEVIVAKPANMYTWFWGIEPDYRVVIDGVVTPMFLTRTGKFVQMPSSYISEASTWCQSRAECTPAHVAITTQQSLGYVVPLAVPAHVKNNVVTYGPLMAWHEALPGIRTRSGFVEKTHSIKLYAGATLAAAVGLVGLAAKLFVGTTVTVEMLQTYSQAVVFAPFIEESLRALYGWPITFGIIVFEFYRACMMGVPQAVLFTTMMHLFSAWLQRNGTVSGWMSAVCVHMSFNQTALFSNWALNTEILKWAPGMAGATFCIAAGVAGSVWKGLSAYCLDNAPKLKDKLPGFHTIVNKFPVCPWTPSLPTALQVRYGLTSDAYRPVAYANNRHNFLTALKQRVCYHEPITDNAAVEANITQFTQWWFNGHNGNAVRFLKPEPIRAVSFTEYLARSNATPAVKAGIARAHEQQKEQGIRRDVPLSSAQKENFVRLKCFVKVENLNYRTPYGTKLKAPRIIMGSDPNYLALVGPWMMALSDHIKKRLDGSQGVLFTSGQTARQCSDFLGCDNGYIDEETDVAHWDRSVSRKLRAFEYKVYKLFRPPPAVKQLLQLDSRRTKGISSLGIKFALAIAIGGLVAPTAQRPSGRPDTSLGNSMTNAMIRVWGFAVRWGVSLETVIKLILVLVQGDDGASRSPASQPRVNWPAVFGALGFELEYRVVKNPADLSFCSMLNYPVLGGHCFGPKVGRIFGKTCWLLDPHPKMDPKAIARGIAIGLSIPGSFLEPLRMWCDRLLQLTVGSKVVKLRTEDWQMAFAPAIADETTACFLAVRYGWCDSMKAALAVELANMTFGGGEGGPVYNYIIERDTDGPVVPSNNSQ